MLINFERFLGLIISALSIPVIWYGTKIFLTSDKLVREGYLNSEVPHVRTFAFMAWVLLIGSLPLMIGLAILGDTIEKTKKKKARQTREANIKRHRARHGSYGGHRSNPVITENDYCSHDWVDEGVDAGLGDMSSIRVYRCSKCGDVSYGS